MNQDPNKIAFMTSKSLVKANKIYQGNILTLYENQIQQNEKILTRELIHHHPAVSVVATTSDDQVVLVEQYRAAVDKPLLELPAGIIDLVDDEFEAPLDACQRELEEETSYRSDHWHEITSFYVSPGYLDEYIYLFRAKQIYQVSQPLAPDFDEEIDVHLFSKNEVKEMLINGKIKDSKTIIGLQDWLMEK